MKKVSVLVALSALFLMTSCGGSTAPAADVPKADSTNKVACDSTCKPVVDTLKK
jgi:PBP1b-binding outer membrane lipoprotein LpoB